MNKTFALVDCNNFFASCERIFNPALHGKPVVVLSNNDGCVIARSNEAKALGIGMGEPYFKCEELILRHKVFVYSANFVLYGDISARVMDTLAQFTPDLEIYSVDEAFLRLDGVCRNPLEYASQIRSTVKRNIGMPVSIGMGPTKTLAKLANAIAKKQTTQGVFEFSNLEEVDCWLAKTPVGDLWGVGHQKEKFLISKGIETALQLKNAPEEWVKKNLSIATLKTVYELKGMACLELEESVSKKGIGTSRTFSKEVTSLEDLQEAIASHTARAAEKLREQQSLCGYLQIYITTNPFKGQYQALGAGIDITPPTAFSPDLIAAAQKLVKGLYKKGCLYKKAGVILSHLQDQSIEQDFLFDQTYQNSRKHTLMKVLDRINGSINRGKLVLAAEGIEKPWTMDQKYISKRFTTRWDELLEIQI